VLARSRKSCTKGVISVAFAFDNEPALALRQGIKHLAPQLGCDAVRKAPFDRSRQERTRVDQPAASYAGNCGDCLLSIALLTALSGRPVRTAASVA
jgi:hypothetical protein